MPTVATETLDPSIAYRQAVGAVIAALQTDERLGLSEEQDTIPADARLIESTALQTAEAALTGESLPVLEDIAPIAEETPLGERVITPRMWRGIVFVGVIMAAGTLADAGTLG